MTARLPLLTLFTVLMSATSVRAADALPQIPSSPQLQKCLQRADDMPDIAAAEAVVWIKKGGGNDAHLCRAFAQANRGMHADAAREFWALGSTYDKPAPGRAISMHNLSGQEFLRAKDIKNAEAQYSLALKISNSNVPALIGRAQTRMEVDRYWDALDDLNRAAKIAPDDADIFRQRGRAWAQLGNQKNAQEDFEKAEALVPLPPAKP